MQQSTGAVCPAPTSPYYVGSSVRWLMHRLPFILLILSAALFIGALVASVVPPRFTASTTLILADGRGLAPVVDTPFATAAIIASPDFAREVVSRLGITSAEDLAPRAIPHVIARWLVSLGIIRHAPEKQTETALIRAYLDALQTASVDDARALSIAIQANEPEIAARAANITAQVYLDRRRASIVARDAAINAAEQKVIQAQAALQQAIEKERSFRVSPAGPDTAQRARTAADGLSLLLAERAALVVEHDAISRRLASIVAMRGSANLFQAPFEGVPLLRHLVEQRLSLRADLAAERRIRDAQDWRVRALSAKAIDVDGQIAEASDSARNWLARERDHLKKRITEVETAIRLRQAIITAATDNSERQQALDRAVISARMELSLEREKLGDELARIKAGSTAAYILKAAEPPQKPDRLWPTIVGIGAALLTALTLSLLTRCLIDAWDNDAERHYTPANMPPISAEVDLEQVFKDEQAQSVDVSQQQPVMPVHKITPAVQPSHIDEAVPASALPTPFSVIRITKGGEGAYEALLKRLAITPRTDGGRHMVVASIDSRIDVSGIAGMLAQFLAHRERVILLDLTLPKTTDATPPPGLNDLIAGRASFAEIITRDPGSRVHYISRGRSKMDADRLGDTAELALAALDQTYDWIVQIVSMQHQDELTHRALTKANGVVLVTQGEKVDVKVTASYEALRKMGIDNIVVALQPLNA